MLKQAFVQLAKLFQLSLFGSPCQNGGGRKSPSKKILRFEAMEDRCMLAVDSGVGTFACDAVYLSYNESDQSAIYDKQVVCDQKTFAPVHTVARIEESVFYQNFFAEMEMLQNMTMSSSSSFPPHVTGTNIFGDYYFQVTKLQPTQSDLFEHNESKIVFYVYGVDLPNSLNVPISINIQSPKINQYQINAYQEVTLYGGGIAQRSQLMGGAGTSGNWNIYGQYLIQEPFFYGSGQYFMQTFSGLYIELTPNNVNDSLPENDTAITLTASTGFWGNSGAETSASFTIKDDDHWKVGSSVVDNEALEPCTWLSVEDRIASYYVYKTPGNANCTDNSYPITVEFELGGTAQASSWNNTDKKDYQLFVGDISNWNNSSSYIALTTVNGKTTGKVTIPAGQTGIMVNLIAMTDSIYENPETASLTVTKAYAVANPRPQDCFQIGLTGGSAMIFQAPEFISDTDKNVNTNSIPFPINADGYKSYISINAQVGDEINTLTPITAKSNRGVRYMIVQGNTALFEINAVSGVINVKQTLKNVDNLQSVYNLRIRAYDLNTGNEKLYDEADVTISISQWTVSRNNGGTAPATPTDGCTIAELADEIGLNADEFKRWLTTTHQSVRLFDDTVATVDSLGLNDPLSGNQTFSNGSQNLAVPNTIYMAWFGEMRGFGKDWMLWDQNIAQLSQMGFNVETFDNDGGLNRYLTPAEAKVSYLSKMQYFATQNYLHGLYFMGHGDEYSVGSSGTNVFTYGPRWSIEYTEMDAVIDYDLGALIIHACHGNDSDARDRLLSDDGIYLGFTNVYRPYTVVPIAKLWGESTENGTIKYGGKQKTKKCNANYQ